MKIMKEKKGNYKTESKPFAYFIPGRNETIKVEKVIHRQYVAHFKEGAERVSFRDMIDEKWECRGKWEAA